MLSEAPVYLKSYNKKIVTRSSTEAELVGISDALSQILWRREYMLHQGFKMGPVTRLVFNKNNIKCGSRSALLLNTEEEEDRMFM